MARKFLYVFAVLIVLAIGAAFAYRFFGADLVRMSLTPFGHYQQQPAVAPNAYADRRMWIARPDIAGNPAAWTPTGVPRPATAGPAAVFFVHPTSYLQRSRWNAPLDDPEANARTELFVRGQASALNGVGDVWAPRYRQAAFGAFLSTQEDAQRALDLAYHDVEVAFAEFVRESGDRPIILAGHSQGSLHLTRLIRDHVAGTPLARRVVAAYIVGWPVSRTADLPVMGLPECTAADQAGCILSWQSFAEPADPSLILDTFDATTGLRWPAAARHHDGLHQSVDRHRQCRCAGERQPRHAHPQCGDDRRDAAGGQRACAVLGTRAAADRCAAGDGRLCAAGQQLSRLRL